VCRSEIQGTVEIFEAVTIKVKEDVEDKQLKHCYPTMKEMVGKIDGTKPRMINDMKRIVGPTENGVATSGSNPGKTMAIIDVTKSDA
jgi:hypothetical protein